MVCAVTILIFALDSTLENAVKGLHSSKSEKT